MKKALFVTMATLGLVFSVNTAFAEYSYTEDWVINSFHSDIKLGSENRVDITEKIVADFTDEYHRGMARIIPYEYELSWYQKYNARINFISAQNESMKSWENTVYKENGNLNIEMRAPADGSIPNTLNEVIIGEATFLINYTASNIIGFFDEQKAKEQNTFSHDEFFWNVNGTEWVVKMNKVSATVYLPRKFEESEIKIDCFTGTYGSTEKDCKYEFQDGDKIFFESTRPFEAYENLSVLVGLPSNTIAQTPAFTKFLWFLDDYKEWGIAPGVFILMMLLWFYKGRDERTFKTTIMPHYKAPKGLLSAECGTIIDENLDTLDITSTIIDYAVKGNIKITELGKKDYELELIKPYVTQKEFEKTILEGIFAKNEAGEKIKLSVLENKYYKVIPKIKKDVYKQLIDDGYFPHNPATIKGIWTTIGVILIFGPLFTGAEMFIDLPVFFSLIISGFIVLIIGRFMSRKTAKGAETYYELKGLYEYINTAEKDRIKFQEDVSVFFEKLLPYAMAFGLVKKWATVFDGIVNEPPSWFSTTHTLNWIYFADSLENFSYRTNSILPSAPSSSGKSGGGSWSGSSGFSGGGFSGGGFGGGGGRGL